MSSNKKLRLDPDNLGQSAHRSSVNTPGASGYFDHSSYSLSANGGHGVYGRSSGPYRTRYTKPSDYASPTPSSFSRFSPYYIGRERRSSLRVPLIRARRDESDQDGFRPSSRASLNSSIGGDSASSATSSTAQRIIETLQNLSTPVMNAGKIRIDQDIKAVQPLSFGPGSSLSRISPGNSMNRSGGPPKMCSSLLLSHPSAANQISPLYGDQRRVFSIPKMVDAATNTDKEVEVVSPQMNVANKATPELKTTPSARPAMPSNIISAKAKLGATLNSKDDKSDDEFHECSTEFTFSQAWSPEIFDKYLSSEKEDKSSKFTVGSGPQQQPLLNGYKDGASPSQTALSKPATPSGPSIVTSTPASSASLPTSISASPKATPGVPTSSFTGASSGTGAFRFGSSPLTDTFTKSKDVPNISTGNKIGFGFKDDTSSAIQKPSPSPLKVASETSSSSVFGISTGIPSSSEKAGGQEPFSFGLNSSTKEPNQTISPSPIDKVDAAKPNNSPMSSVPSTTASTVDSKISPIPFTVKLPTNKWRCPSCMVENDQSSQTCVCCTEKNPNAPLVAAKPVSKKWACPTCMVSNDIDVPACVCCTEKNPNASSFSKPVAKKWRCATCMVENDPSSTNCVCCTEKNPNASNLTKTVEAAKPPAPAFKFGVSHSSVSSSPVGSTFTFGKSDSNELQKPPAAFKFGAPTAASTSTSSSSSTTEPATVNTPFKFGSSALTTSQPAPIPSFGFSAPSTTSSQSTLPISTPTTSINPFGSSKPASETISISPAGGSIPVFGSSSFQPLASSQPSSGLSFGASQGAPSDSQKPPSTFSFGASAKSFNTFSFGSSSQQNTMNVIPGANNPPGLAPAPTPVGPNQSLSATPNFSFISANPSAASPFGQAVAPSALTPQSPPTGMFQFGSSNPSNAAATAPTTGFSLTPNMNFGAANPGNSIPSFGSSLQPTPAAGSQAPPALFQFGSSSSAANESPGGRKIKKAARRLHK